MVPAFTPLPALCRGANNVGGDTERSLKAENNSSQFDLFHYYVFLNVGVQIQSVGFCCDIFTHGHQCILLSFVTVPLATLSQLGRKPECPWERHRGLSTVGPFQSCFASSGPKITTNNLANILTFQAFAEPIPLERGEARDRHKVRVNHNPGSSYRLVWSSCIFP